LVSEEAFVQESQIKIF